MKDAYQKNTKAKNGLNVAGLCLIWRTSKDTESPMLCSPYVARSYGNMCAVQIMKKHDEFR